MRTHHGLRRGLPGGLALVLALGACGGRDDGDQQQVAAPPAAVTVVPLAEVPTAPPPLISPRPLPATATRPATATARPSPTAPPAAEAAPTGDATPAALPTGVSREEYAVLSALLRGGYVVRGQRSLVLQDMTEMPAGAVQQAEGLGNVYGLPLVSDFVARNVRPTLLDKQISVPVANHLVRRADLDGLISDPSGARYARRFPRSNGFVSVSRVGFDETGELAMVAVGHTMAAGVGRGTLYVLAREGGRWSVVDAVPLWVR